MTTWKNKYINYKNFSHLSAKIFTVFIENIFDISNKFW